MGQMLIRDLDDAVLQRRERRAEASRTSAGKEARRALTEHAAAAPPPFDADARRAETLAFAKSMGPIDGPDSTEFLRADRYRDGRR